MKETKNNERLQALEMISNQVGNAYTAEQIGIVQKNIAKGTTASELAYFLNVCNTMDLNPFNKEVWCYKDNRNNLLIFSGRDGFLAKAQKNKDFAGIRSIEVCENDEFNFDVLNNKINHIIKNNKKNRGKILYGVAIVFRKNGEPTIEIADFDTYNKGYNTWKTHPAEMIKKVAETHALKKAFGISGIQSEYDFEKKGNYVEPINKVDIEQELINAWNNEDVSHLKEEDIIHIQRIIEEKEVNSYNKALKVIRNE